MRPARSDDQLHGSVVSGSAIMAAAAQHPKLNLEHSGAPKIDGRRHPALCKPWKPARHKAVSAIALNLRVIKNADEFTGKLAAMKGTVCGVAG